MSLSKFSCPLDIQSDTKCFTTLLLQLYFPCKCEEETKRCIVKSWLRPHSCGRPSHITLNTHRYLWGKKGLSLWRVVHKSTTSNCFLLLALLILPSFWFPSEGALYKEVAFFSLARAKVTSKYKSKKVLLAFTAALLFLALTSLLAAAAVVTPASLFCAVLKHSKYGILH